MDLELIIQKAADAYYNGIPIMSDSEFDALVDKLRATNPSSPILAHVGAPAPTTSAWKKVKHSIPMGSLSKVQILSELEAWVEERGQNLVVSEKLDGISVSVRVVQGHFVQALTRGDGEIGEDISRNVALMQGLPSNPFCNWTGWIRGEIICKKSVHRLRFPGDANCRNTASGTAKRQSDASKCQYLDVLFYQAIPDSGPLPFKEDEFEVLESLGVQTPNWFPIRDPATVYSKLETLYLEYTSSKRSSLDYEIDGLVVELSDIKTASELGDLHGRPRGSVALKFPSECKTTQLNGIEWQVGHTGRVTPVAILEPVSIMGVTISRASLACLQQLRAVWQHNMLPCIGDTVLVSRRNDVIPYIESVISYGSTALPIPHECPSCKSTLVENGAYLECQNGLSCSAQVVGRLQRWVDKVGVLDWGPAVLETLVESGRVSDIPGLYTLTYGELSSLPMQGRVLGSIAQKMLDQLHAKKSLPLHLLVGSLGIPLMGRSSIKLLVDAGFNTADKLKNIRFREVAAIAGMGNEKAAMFIQHFPAAFWCIQNLERVGVTVKQPTAGSMTGKSVCFTGFRDKLMEEAFEAQGGTIKSGVSKGLTYLVAKDANSGSSKLEKAKAMGVVVMTPDGMKNLLGL